MGTSACSDAEPEIRGGRPEVHAVPRCSLLVPRWPAYDGAGVRGEEVVCTIGRWSARRVGAPVRSPDRLGSVSSLGGRPPQIAGPWPGRRLQRLARRPSQTCEASRRPVSWRIRGTYFESCNCDAVCPCRRIDGVSGGRSTHGVFEGSCRGSSRTVSRVEPTCPAYRSRWPRATASMSRDRRGPTSCISTRCLGRAASRARGHLRRPTRRRCPAALSVGVEGERAASVRPAAIEDDHTPRRGLRVRDHVTVRIRDRHDGGETVTCVIPGHDGRARTRRGRPPRPEAAAFEYHGVCGYGSSSTTPASCAVVDPGRAAVENPRRRPRGCSMSWNVKGSYVETCSCELMCPCNLSFDHGATYDFCRVTLVFDIHGGASTGPASAGCVAVIADTPKVMTEGNGGSACSSTTGDRRAGRKLVQVFSGQLGGPMGALAPLVGRSSASSARGSRWSTTDSSQRPRRRRHRLRDRGHRPLRGRDRHARAL